MPLRWKHKSGVDSVRQNLVFVKNKWVSKTLTNNYIIFNQKVALNSLKSISKKKKKKTNKQQKTKNSFIDVKDMTVDATQQIPNNHSDILS